MSKQRKLNTIRFAISFFFACFLTKPSSADKGEHVVAVGAGATFIGLTDKTHLGGQATAFYDKGISNTLWMSLGLGAAAANHAAYALTPSLSLKAKLDVIQYVPWASIGMGTMLTHTPDDSFAFTPGLMAAVGLDVLCQHDRSIGIALSRLQGFPRSQTALTVNTSWHWGFF